VNNYIKLKIFILVLSSTIFFSSCVTVKKNKNRSCKLGIKELIIYDLEKTDTLVLINQNLNLSKFEGFASTKPALKIVYEKCYQKTVVLESAFDLGAKSKLIDYEPNESELNEGIKYFSFSPMFKSKEKLMYYIFVEQRIEGEKMIYLAKLRKKKNNYFLEEIVDGNIFH